MPRPGAATRVASIIVASVVPVVSASRLWPMPASKTIPSTTKNNGRGV